MTAFDYLHAHPIAACFVCLLYLLTLGVPLVIALSWLDTVRWRDRR